MVDITTLQAWGYLFGYVSVSIAALSFAFNIRATTKSRRANHTNNLMNSFLSEEGMKRFHELEIMEWRDFEDFRRKYDSTVNPENYVKRQAFWNTCDLIGYQYKEGLVDLGTVYNAGGIFIAYSWLMFEPIIKEYRKTQYGPDDYENYEYVANELLKMKEKRNPGYVKRMRDFYTTSTSNR